MSAPPKIPQNINPGVYVMPTNHDVLKKAQEEMKDDFRTPSAGTMNAEASERAFQGSVSVSDSQTAVSVSFLTDEKQIEAMLPPGKNLSVGGPPVVNVSFVYQGGLKWLAGRSYNLVVVALPVVHSGKNGKTHGRFLPVVWENMTEPILMGRETLGWPKIYADIPPARKLYDTFQCIATWHGFHFLDVNVTNIHELTPEEQKQQAENAKKAPPNAGAICHKFILKTGKPGETDADYLTISTNEGAAGSTVREVLIGKADIRFNKGTFEQLPTMRHIVDQLADLEIKEVYDAFVVTQTGGGMGATKMLE
jgi:hypothetical protein